MSQPQVIVRSDSPLLAAGIRAALGEPVETVALHPPFTVVGATQVVLLDLVCSDTDGVRALSDGSVPSGRAIVMIDASSSPSVRDVLSAGASGVIPRSCSSDDLRSAVSAVAGGGTYIHPSLLDQLISGLRQHGPGSTRLSPREAEVMMLMAASLTNREIAARLWISERTVKFHVANILTKLDVNNRRDAVAAFSGAVLPPTGRGVARAD